MGGTTLPGLTLETAKEHTRVSCGWPDARDACKARPTIEAQGLASLYHHSPAWPHRPIKTRPSPLSFFLFTSSVSLSSHPLSLSVTFLLHSLAQNFTKHLTHSSFPPLPLLIASDWEKKRDGQREMRLREREGENQRKRGS